MTSLVDLEKKFSKTLQIDFTDNYENDCENTCGICKLKYDTTSDNFYELSCGHKFHYLCIDEYYRNTLAKFLSNKKYNYVSNIIPRECPYCRDKSSLLDIKMNVKPQKGIHSFKKTVSRSITKKKCLGTCKNGNKCKKHGSDKYNGFCFVHKNQFNENKE